MIIIPSGLSTLEKNEQLIQISKGAKQTCYKAD